MKQSYKRENQEVKGEKVDDKKIENQFGRSGGATQREPLRGLKF